MKKICVALILVFTVNAWCQDAGDDRKAVQGKWTPVSGEVAGTKLPASQLGTISLVLGDGVYSVKAGETIDKGTFKADPTAKPKTLDIVGTDGPNKGKTFLAIYELKGDTMRVCYDMAGKNRPTEFATTKENKYFYAVYQRAK